MLFQCNPRKQNNPFVTIPYLLEVRLLKLAFVLGKVNTTLSLILKKNLTIAFFFKTNSLKVFKTINCRFLWIDFQSIVFVLFRIIQFQHPESAIESL